MNVSIPKDWISVPEHEFEDYLKWCNDYTRDIFADGEYYQFRGGHRFAVHPKDRDIVFVHPEVLKETA